MQHCSKDVPCRALLLSKCVEAVLHMELGHRGASEQNTQVHFGSSTELKGALLLNKPVTSK